MTDVAVKILRCFQLARSVNHHYWEHVADAAENMRVQNLEHIVSRIVQLPIHKYAVRYPGGAFIRGLYERYADKIIIYVRADQTPEWIPVHYRKRAVSRAH